MKFFESVHKNILSFFNRPYIKQDLLNNIKGPILLHISDTPIQVYNYIFRVIDILQPEFIIHTGDMVDNIKLEIDPNRLSCYNQGVSKLIAGLEKSTASEIYYILGNHDHYTTLANLAKKGTIIRKDIITINNLKFAVSHYHEDFPHNPDFILYGHSFRPASHMKKDKIFLNGLLNINIIDLSTKEIYFLEYPIGTNSARRMEFKAVGL